jgi:hypothetical protein
MSSSEERDRVCMICLDTVDKISCITAPCGFNSAYFHKNCLVNHRKTFLYESSNNFHKTYRCPHCNIDVEYTREAQHEDSMSNVIDNIEQVILEWIQQSSSYWVCKSPLLIANHGLSCINSDQIDSKRIVNCIIRLLHEHVKPFRAVTVLKQNHSKPYSRTIKCISRLGSYHPCEFMIELNRVAYFGKCLIDGYELMGFKRRCMHRKYVY